MAEDRTILTALFEAIADALAYVVSVFERATENPIAAISLLRQLGWDVPFGSTISSNATSLSTALQSLYDLLANGATLPEVVSVVESITAAQENLTEELGLDIADDFSRALGEELPHQLPDYALVTYLEDEYPRLAALLSLLGLLVVEQEEPTDHFRIPYQRRQIRWNLLINLLKEPERFHEHAYGWGTPEYDGPYLLDTFHSILAAFDASVGRFTPDDSVSLIGESVGEPLCAEFVDWADFSIGVELYEVEDSASGDAGLAIAPYVTANTEQDYEIGNFMIVRVAGGLEIPRGFGVELRQESGVCLFGTDLLQTAEGSLRVTILVAPPEQLFRIGRPDSNMLALRGVTVGLWMELQAGDVDFGLEIGLDRLSFVLSTQGADSFLRRILSDFDVSSEIDLVLGLGLRRGLYLQGSGAFELTIPAQRSIGPVKLNSVYLGARPEGSRAPVLIGVSLGAELGPVSASIDRFGLRLDLGLEGGNLGPIDLDVGFLPPKGAGLSINAGGITGGGFLEFDHANKRYAGVLALNFGEIGLTAIGLITTRMPDGSDGFALLVNIGVTFDPPIQLSFGFTLSGVGGLVGVNRSMQIDVLRRGLKNRTLDSILFPDPDTVIANAPKIISDLRAVFPPADDRYVVGPMVRIGWGSPNIITAELGIFLEFPDPIRLVLMGQVEAAFPEKDTALILIHLDILGVVDFAKEELTFQACLYDSRVMSYSLSGDSAFLLGWGRNPRFALALGGFHPRFTPPPPPIVFADLKRLTLSISKGGRALQLSCQAYQALTPNSLQFGAKVSLHASAGGLTAEGNLGFDALFYFSPFSFEIEIGGGVYIKYEGVSLVDVHLTLFLSGPTPWHARGKATVKILCISIPVGFDETWGSEEQALLSPVDPWELLQDALANRGNWSSLLPAGRPTVASLRSLETDQPDGPVVHPAGRLEVRQKVVPLGVRLDKVGNAPITGPDLFDITDLRVNGDSLRPLDPVEEFFARGQFEELAADQKLSLPAFEKMKGGVTAAASAGVRIDGDPESWTLAYESILIKPDRTSQRQEPEGQEPEGEFDWFDWQHAELVVKSHATRRAAQRAGPRKQFSALRPQPRVEVGEERYCIAKASNLTWVDLDPALGQDNRGMTRMLADQVLKAQLEHHPDQAGELLVIPECEVAA
jgi:hypothetical protein